MKANDPVFERSASPPLACTPTPVPVISEYPPGDGLAEGDDDGEVEGLSEGEGLSLAEGLSDGLELGLSDGEDAMCAPPSYASIV